MWKYASETHNCILPLLELRITAKSDMELHFFIAYKHLHLIQIIEVITKVKDNLLDRHFSILVMVERKHATGKRVLLKTLCTLVFDHIDACHAAGLLHPCSLNST